MAPQTDPSFMKSPSSMRGAFTDNKPVLQSISSNDPAIDYIGRWDSSSGAGKTARWAGSSVRFTFSGPLLFLIPGPDTVSTAFPTVGWQVDNNSRVTYTATARPHQSIRLWPPEGRAHGQFHASPDGIDENGGSDDNGDAPVRHAAHTPPTSAESGGALPVLLQEQNGAVGETMSRSTTSSQLADGSDSGNGHGASAAISERGSAIRSRPSTSGGRSAAYSLDQDGDGEAPGTHTIEITLIDWASVLQISAFQLLSSHSISSPYAPVPPLSASTSASPPSATPSGIASLPTLLFVGDSITSGYVATPEDAAGAGGYCGFLDAYPSKLKSILSPGVRVSAVAFPGITLCDDQETGQDGMESRWFKRGPVDIPSASRRDASTSSNSSSPAPRSASGASSPAEGDLARLRSALPEDFDWDFEGRDDETGPTHILVALGQNDYAPSDKFISTYRDFLSLLKETHGRRTGDILVMPPFGHRVISEQIPPADGTGPARFRYEQNYYDEIKEMVHELRQRWVQEAQDPLSSGDFPTTPIFELTKLQLDALPSHGMSDPGSSHLHGRVRGHSHTDSSGSLSAKIQRAAAEAAGSDPGATPTQSNFPPVGLPSSGSLASLASVAGVRPALVVRPSSIAAVEPTSRGTKARLHCVDTKGWLSTEDETFDGVHPTPKGAKVIARKLRDWLRDNGFLAES